MFPSFPSAPFDPHFPREPRSGKQIRLFFLPPSEVPRCVPRFSALSTPFPPILQSCPPHLPRKRIQATMWRPKLGGATSCRTVSQAYGAAGSRTSTSRKRRYSSCFLPPVSRAVLHEFVRFPVFNSRLTVPEQIAAIHVPLYSRFVVASGTKHPWQIEIEEAKHPW